MELPYTEFYANPRIMPMIGDPIGGGPIPAAYNKFFESVGLNRTLLPLKLAKGSLPEFMKVAKFLGIEQFTLTMPHKADIIPLLDEVDEASRLFSSVNVVTSIDGKYYGRGYDGIGTVGALKAAGAKLQGASVMMTGAGSISGIIGYELAKNGVANLTILNRTVANAQAVADKLNANTQMKSVAGGMTNAELDAAAEKADVMLQVSAQGMRVVGDFAYLGFVDKLPKSCIVMEGVMAPIDTGLVKAATAAGFEPILGLDMTMHELGTIFKNLFDLTLEDQHKRMMVQIICAGYGQPLPKHWQ
ncbi:MAG: hypothetical protein GXY32_09230 [Ruminococcaceae bacterium]|nr:hypothetical protein [Oscillospiraceae bacterium]